MQIVVRVLKLAMTFVVITSGFAAPTTGKGSLVPVTSLRDGGSFATQNISRQNGGHATHNTTSRREACKSRAKHHRHHAAGQHQNDTLTGTELSGNAGVASAYRIVQQWAGSRFFEGWDFFVGSDPTHGLVQYVDSQALAYVENAVAYIKVDTSDLSQGTPRKSIRISTQKRFDGGLFVTDIKKMPYGMATWPAFWTHGDPWPDNGEIDIIEGVNDNVQNQYTVHSAEGCAIDMTSTSSHSFLVPGLDSTVTQTTCASSSVDNNGCAFIDASHTSYGESFNAAGGGVFAMEWTNDGIRIWSFPRGDIPADLTRQKPDPSSWSRSYMKAAWSSTDCDTKKYFKQHTITFDITLCGDWAGNAFPGGIEKCEAHVAAGSNFNHAAWAVNSVTVYQV